MSIYATAFQKHLAYSLYFASFRLRSSGNTRGPSPFPPETAKRSEDNHSLLHNEAPINGLTKDFCGQFAGFTLTPLKQKEPEPVRAAPPVPAVPPVPTVAVKTPTVHRANTTADKAVFLNKPVTRSHSYKPSALTTALANANSASVAPALPPPNPGSSARPIISSPILENSTCTAKELISPLRNAPKVPCRPAPEMPPPALKETKRPLSSPDAVVNSVTFADDVLKKPQKEANGALNRIASFLSKNDKKPPVNTNSLPRTKVSKINKEDLRNIEISNPIPQTTIDIAITALPVDTEENKAVVMRAQSMRATKPSTRPNIPNFGSMRNPPGLKRPLSIPSGTRPKSPPPPLPPTVTENKKSDQGFKVPSLPGFQKPAAKPTKQNQYDDCLNEAPLAKSEGTSPVSNDNIYAVIEEASSPEIKKNSSGSSESMGLLGEIVTEIQSRNFDSIYSTSTLARQKREKEEQNQKANPTSDIYMNTPPVYKSPESVYSNMSNVKSSASSTSSGYINPNLVNPPIKPQVSSEAGSSEPSQVALSTFKSVETPKVNKQTLPSRGRQSPTGAKKDATPKVTAPIMNVSKPSKPLSRQTTPPNLRTRKASPTRPAPPSPKTTNPTSNSPDLVTSCSNNSNNKSPDVLNSGAKKPVISASKPAPLPKTLSKINKSVSMKVGDKKVGDKPPVSAKISKAVSDAGTKVMPAGARVAAKQSSNVASLQQKFENKPPISAKTVTVGKK